MKKKLSNMMGIIIFVCMLIVLLTPRLTLAQYTVGDTVANFTLRDIEGNNVSLYNYRGSCILLYFCVTWCPDCTAEAPIVETNIWQSYRMLGLQVLGIDISENATKVSNWVNSLGLTYPWLLDPDALIWAKYTNPSNLVPYYVFIDPTMFIRYTKISYNESELKAVIEEYLPIHGNVIHVPADYPTIQDAINVANKGDTVLVAPGIYNLSSSIMNDRVDHLFLLGSRKDDGKDASIITAQGNQGIFTCIFFQNVAGCKIAGFEITKGSSGVVFEKCHNCLLTKNYIHNNDELSAWHGNGVGIFNSHSIDVTYCVLDSNEFHGIQLENSESINIINNTILNVYRYDGIALGANPKKMTIKNNIVAFTNDEAIELTGTPEDFIHDYNCYWQNGRGPVKGLPLSSHEMIVYPRIADMTRHDYYLLPDSPCLGAGDKGVNIGALGAKKYVKIYSISDIPNDQGKQVRVIWEPDYFDGRSNLKEITHYALWRRVDDQRRSSHLKSYQVKEISKLISECTSLNKITSGLITSKNELWDFISLIPACQFSQYSYVAPTLADSTDAGIPYAVFMVSAHYSDLNAFVFSDPDSGYSVDNLAPSPPAGLTISQHQTGGTWQAVVRWKHVPDEDFNYYRLYRSTKEGFDPTSVTLYATTSDTFFVDTKIDFGENYFYRVTAIDFSGNESDYSDECSIAVNVASLGHPLLPTEFAMFQNYPNPFNAATNINYQLPRASQVFITIYNTCGQEIRTLINAEKAAGYYTIQWDGKDDQGHQVGTGIYLCQMRAGGCTLTKKMAIVK